MTQSQLDLIRKMDWDYLIILDACRYDYFEKVYRKYLKEGKLKKVISPASYTLEWAQKVFLNTKLFRNVIYISANPYINSKKPMEGIDFRSEFKKIIDVWYSNWNDKVNTILPRDMTKKAIETIKKNKDSKIIIHYLQPHAPYLTDKISRIFISNFNLKKKRIRKPIIPKKIRRYYEFFINYFFPLPILKLYWKFLIYMGAIPNNETVAFTRLSIKEWRKKYEENLEFVLKYVKELVEFIPSGKIVITADHGELLGDRFWFGYKIGHHPYLKYKELKEVPWLEIDKGKKETEGESEGKKEKKEEEYSEKDEEIIKERLRALGYLE